MIWEKDLESISYQIHLNQGYELKIFNPVTDTELYQQLLIETEMGECPLDYWMKHILPNGFFVVKEVSTGKIVGACFSSHHPTDRHKMAGNLGWLAVDKTHRGARIGEVLVFSVIQRLKSAGYNRIFLETHDFRVPAIKLYFKTGWQPYLYNHDVSVRWRIICEQLNVDFKEKEWSIIN
jgi:mycothiol synthase